MIWASGGNVGFLSGSGAISSGVDCLHLPANRTLPILACRFRIVVTSTGVVSSKYHIARHLSRLMWLNHHPKRSLGRASAPCTSAPITVAARACTRACKGPS